MHSALRATAKQSAHLAALFERPAYPCNLRRMLSAAPATREGKPETDTESDIETDDEDADKDADEDADADADGDGGSGRGRGTLAGGLSAIVTACGQSAALASEALRTGAGRGVNADLYASEAISRAALVFCTLASAGQAAGGR